MSTEQYLNSLGVTMDAAYQFIMENLNNLNAIYTVCSQFGITNNMIADVLTYKGLSVSGTDVANYFALNGIDSNSLGGSSRTINVNQDVAPDVSNTSYTIENGVFTNTGTGDIVIMDYGFDANGSFSGYGQTITFAMSGTIEEGYTVSVYGMNQYVSGYNFPDYTLSTNEHFYLNDFMPDTYSLAGTGMTGQMNMEMSIITTVGTFTDQTVVYYA